jgi:hypothetical protein
MKITRALAPVLALSVLSALGACSTSDQAGSGELAGNETSSSLSTPSGVDLPDEIVPGSNAAIAWEALMGPDGEYAAVAHYQAVLDQFGQVEPYATIKESEERHIDALVRQLSRYNVEAPANPYLGVVEAPGDLETAAREWAEGEILNVEMYDQLIKQATDDRLIRVLENLRRASLEQHFPAFEAAAANGGTVDPEKMANGIGRP